MKGKEMELINVIDKRVIKHMNDVFNDTKKGWLDMSTLYLNCKVTNDNKFIQRIGEKVLYRDEYNVVVIRRGKEEVMTYKKFFKLFNRLLDKVIISELHEPKFWHDEIIERLQILSLDDHIILEDIEDIYEVYQDGDIKSCMAGTPREDLELYELLGLKLLYVDNPLIKFRSLLMERDGVTYFFPTYCNANIDDYKLDNKMIEMGYVDIIDFKESFTIPSPKILCYIDVLDLFLNVKQENIVVCVNKEPNDDEIDIGYIVDGGEAKSLVDVVIEKLKNIDVFDKYFVDVVENDSNNHKFFKNFGEPWIQDMIEKASEGPKEVVQEEISKEKNKIGGLIGERKYDDYAIKHGFKVKRIDSPRNPILPEGLDTVHISNVIKPQSLEYGRCLLHETRHLLDHKEGVIDIVDLSSNLDPIKLAKAEVRAMVSESIIMEREDYLNYRRKQIEERHLYGLESITSEAMLEMFKKEELEILGFTINNKEKIK